MDFVLLLESWVIRAIVFHDPVRINETPLYIIVVFIPAQIEPGPRPVQFQPVFAWVELCSQHNFVDRGPTINNNCTNDILDF